jgi:4-amino-4-deoxychorismate lyase
MWYAGKLIELGRIELGIDDPGLLYGATVFTTLRVYHHSLDDGRTNWRGHRGRLSNSIKTFGWQEPKWERIREGAEVLGREFPVLRITIFPDGREWIVGRQLPEDLVERQEKGVVGWLAQGAEFRRSLGEHKTGNYLTAWLALNQAKKYGAKEAILIDESGNWLETSTGNLWGWQDGRWWTPPLTAGILPGLMRKQLIDWLLSQNQIVEEEPWTADLVLGMEAIAYSNSVVEVVPIHTVVGGWGDGGTRGQGDSWDKGTL